MSVSSDQQEHSADESMVLSATGMDIFQSRTLKRNPKTDMDKADLLQLLSYLEGELQAKDVVIASLKMDQVRQMLSRAKYGWSDITDPVSALQHDSELAKGTESDDAAIRGIYGNQLMQLERLIGTQRIAQQQMRDQLVAVEKQYHRTCAELEDIKQKHAGEIKLAESVTCMLEKDRDRYKQEAEYHCARCKQLDGQLKAASENRSENQNVVAKHRQVAMMLLRERSRLVQKLLQTRESSAELEQSLKEERERSSLLEENLERQVAECEQLCSRLASAESLNRTLQIELDTHRLKLASKIPQQVVDDVVAGTNNGSNLLRSANSPQMSLSTSDLDIRRLEDNSKKSSESTPFALRNSGGSNRTNGSTLSKPSVEKWAVPMNRNIAAARLRSVLSAAIDGSVSIVPGEPSHARHLASLSPANSTPYQNSKPEAFGHQLGTKFPQMSSSTNMLPSFASGHSMQRSVVLPPAGSAGSHSSDSNRTASRLTPLAPVSPRLTPLAMPASQTNGEISLPSAGNIHLQKSVHSNTK